MRRKISTLLLVTTVIASMTGCSNKNIRGEVGAVSQSDAVEGTELEDATIYVFIAASLSNAMEEVKSLYNATHENIEIVYNADGSGTLQTQIEEGASCDMFFSAASKQMNALVEEGYVIDGSVVNLLENKVVLIKPKGYETEVTGFDNVASAANLVMGGEDVPAGQYAREIFTNIGVYDEVMAMEINTAANVSAVLAAVGEQSNEVGVVYATDAYSASDSVEIIAAAPEGSLNTPVVYPVGLINNTEADNAQKLAAADFEEFLSSDEVAEIFESYGFVAYE